MPFVQENDNTGSGTSLGVAFLASPTAGNFLAYASGGDGDATGVSDNRNGAALKAGDVNNTGLAVYADIHFVRRHAGGGATTATRTTASSSNHSLAVLEYDGCSSPQPRAADPTTSTSGASHSAGPVPAKNQDIAIAVVCCDTAFESYTPDGSFTERADTSGVRPIQVQDRMLTDDVPNLTATITADLGGGGANRNLNSVLAVFDIVARAVRADYSDYPKFPLRS
jgi:hypothetical protein